MMIRFDAPKNIKGLLLTGQQLARQKCTLYLAHVDGEWQPYKSWTMDSQKTELPIGSYVAGIMKEGITADRIKLLFNSKKALQISYSLFGTDQ